MANTPEAAVKNEIKKTLKRHGAYYFMPVQNGMGAPSLDFLVCHHGRWIGIEAKASGKKPTKRQEITMQQMRDAGGICMVVDGEQTLRVLDVWLTSVTSNELPTA